MQLGRLRRLSRVPCAPACASTDAFAACRVSSYVAATHAAASFAPAARTAARASREFTDMPALLRPQDADVGRSLLLGRLRSLSRMQPACLHAA